MASENDNQSKFKQTNVNLAAFKEDALNVVNEKFSSKHKGKKKDLEIPVKESMLNTTKKAKMPSEIKIKKAAGITFADASRGPGKTRWTFDQYPNNVASHRKPFKQFSIYPE